MRLRFPMDHALALAHAHARRTDFLKEFLMIGQGQGHGHGQGHDPSENANANANVHDIGPHQVHFVHLKYPESRGLISVYIIHATV